MGITAVYHQEYMKVIEKRNFLACLIFKMNLFEIPHHLFSYGQTYDHVSYRDVVIL